ncbi:MAG: 2-dehydro-3-deoxygalactonokinase, partial [Burkholderiales bacterium]|nr:2-dehydro-3-deoxygalactonokinase [Burkholderiales bacterium]
MAHLIALDWGTTSLRAYLLDDAGAILDRREGGPGIMKVDGGGFEAALEAFCGDWIAAHPQARLVASGMIGSKQGWREAPYCPCPASAADLAAHTIDVPLARGRHLTIVPGVSCVDPASGVPDVMRGEETQVFGALPASGRHLAVLPGTHSKWVWVEDGAIVTFASFMTGEVYAALTGHTILGRLMDLDAPHDEAAFARGVAYGLEAPQA